MEILNSNTEDSSLNLEEIIDYKKHPIFSTRYILPTPPINELTYNVLNWLSSRDTGAVVYGRPRLGKTRSLMALKIYLQSNEYKNMPVFTVNCRWQQMARERQFYEDMLEATKHELIKQGTPGDKRRRLLNHLLNETHKNSQDMMVLFIDEAQHLLEPHYYWLMDIYNELEARGLYVFYLFVGQMELKNRRTSFIELGRHQIIGRFMTKEHAFRGIESLEDIEEVLNGYDNQAEWPPNSGCSFTRFFFPEAFDQGHRLLEFANYLYTYITEVRKSNSLFGKTVIPMQYLSGTIEHIFKQFGKYNSCPNEWISVSCLKKAVIESGYIDAEVGLSYVHKK